MKQTKHSHIPFLALAVMSTLFVFAAFIYVYVTANRQADESMELRRTALEANQSRASDAIFAKAFLNSAESWRSLESYMVHSKNLVPFMESIESSGDKFGSKVSIVSINADDVNSMSPGSLGKARLAINAIGSWQSVMATVKYIEDMPYKSSISNLTLDAHEKIWTATFSLEVGILRDAQESK